MKGLRQQAFAGIHEPETFSIGQKVGQSSNFDSRTDDGALESRGDSELPLV